MFKFIYLFDIQIANQINSSGQIWIVCPSIIFFFFKIKANQKTNFASFITYLIHVFSFRGSAKYKYFLAEIGRNFPEMVLKILQNLHPRIIYKILNIFKYCSSGAKMMNWGISSLNLFLQFFLELARPISKPDVAQIFVTNATFICF